MLHEYQEGKISVSHLNIKAFELVKADGASLLETVRGKVKIRPGFRQMIAYCRQRGFRVVIVSNGLEFYIREIMKGTGLGDIEIYAAQTRFHPTGLNVRYIGPDGNNLDNDFKVAHTESFRSQGYRIIYAGNGVSDFASARISDYVFATGNLLESYQKADLRCIPFVDFNDVVKGLKLLS